MDRSKNRSPASSSHWQGGIHAKPGLVDQSTIEDAKGFLGLSLEQGIKFSGPLRITQDWWLRVLKLYGRQNISAPTSTPCASFANWNETSRDHI